MLSCGETCSSVGQVLLDPLELLRRHDVRRVELTGAVLAQFGARIGDMQEMHVLERVAALFQ